jgi:hypothetical protein
MQEFTVWIWYIRSINRDGDNSQEAIKAMCYCFILVSVALVLAPEKKLDTINNEVYIALQDHTKTKDVAISTCAQGVHQSRVFRRRIERMSSNT